jgi:hypothetical protein
VLTYRLLFGCWPISVYVLETKLRTVLNGLIVSDNEILFICLQVFIDWHWVVDGGGERL